jgi:hypothetical protein
MTIQAKLSANNAMEMQSMPFSKLLIALISPQIAKASGGQYAEKSYD